MRETQRALVFVPWQWTIPHQVLIQELNLTHAVLTTSCKYPVNLLYSSILILTGCSSAVSILSVYNNKTAHTEQIFLPVYCWLQSGLLKFIELKRISFKILEDKSKEKNLIIKPLDEVCMGPMQCHWFQDDGWYRLKSVVSLKSG